MNKAHSIGKVAFRGKTMRITVDGCAYSVNLAEHSRKLACASAQQRRRFEVSPSGYGIHWPGLDEDLSVGRLVGQGHATRLGGAARSRGL